MLAAARDVARGTASFAGDVAHAAGGLVLICVVLVLERAFGPEQPEGARERYERARRGWK